MKFIDEASIEISSGKGGPGAVHFMRQKYMPKMGPDGGDGGRGGHVTVEATSDLQSLLDFKFNSRFEAGSSQDGGGNDCNGRNGKDLTLRVPPGTVITDLETGQILADLVESGLSVTLAKGGRGGLGNMNFATASRQAPDFAQPGEPATTRQIKLELKLLADVGLVGFPNAGKSTFISRVSSARPKIADYPFTTLVPNLGVVRSRDLDFVVADIPGLIEGASEGRGLGIRFLKHCERTRLLVILLDLDPHTGRKLLPELKILEAELAAFSEELASKSRLIVLNKTDAFGTGINDPLFQDFLKERGYEELEQALKNRRDARAAIMISAVSGAGVDELKDLIGAELKKMGPRTQTHEVSTPALNLGNPHLFDKSQRKQL